MKNTLKLAVYVVAALSALATVSCSKDKVNVTPVNQKPPVTQDTTIKLEIIGTSISETGATINSTIISEGGATITERGIVFSKSTNPTLTDTQLTNTGSCVCKFCIRKCWICTFTEYDTSFSYSCPSLTNYS